MDILIVCESVKDKLISTAELRSKECWPCYEFMELRTKKCIKANELLDMDDLHTLLLSIRSIIIPIHQSVKELQNDPTERRTQQLKLKNICTRSIALISEYYSQYESESDSRNVIESNINCLTALGVYNYYLAESVDVEDESDIAEYTQNTEKFLEKAMVLAAEHFSETEPIRLQSELHFSLFCEAVLGDWFKAMNITRDSFDAALERLDTLEGYSQEYQELTKVMQLQRDMLTKWHDQYGRILISGFIRTLTFYSVSFAVQNLGHCGPRTTNLVRGYIRNIEASLCINQDPRDIVRICLAFYFQRDLCPDNVKEMCRAMMPFDIFFSQRD